MDLSQSCEDINECDKGDVCGEHALCVNRNGFDKSSEIIKVTLVEYVFWSNIYRIKTRKDRPGTSACASAASPCSMEHAVS